MFRGEAFYYLHLKVNWEKVEKPPLQNKAPGKHPPHFFGERILSHRYFDSYLHMRSPNMCPPMLIYIFEVQMFILGCYLHIQSPNKSLINYIRILK